MKKCNDENEFPPAVKRGPGEDPVVRRIYQYNLE
jgi:hypothetical protein